MLNFQYFSMKFPRWATEIFNADSQVETRYISAIGSDLRDHILDLNRAHQMLNFQYFSMKFPRWATEIFNADSQVETRYISATDRS
jgi:carbamoylphosphate synthase large subunit